MLPEVGRISDPALLDYGLELFVYKYTTSINTHPVADYKIVAMSRFDHYSFERHLKFALFDPFSAKRTGRKHLTSSTAIMSTDMFSSYHKILIQQ